jgi:hypothetical protein
LKAAILQDKEMLKAMPGNIDPQVMNEVLIPKIIRTKYPELSDIELEEVRQHVVVDSVIKNGVIKEVGDKRFLRLPGKFIDIDDIDIDLIDSINPFQRAFEIMSKSVTKEVLKVIQEHIQAKRIKMTDDEAMILYPKIKKFIKANQGKKPSIDSKNPQEQEMAEALIYLIEADRRRKRMQSEI